MFSPGNIGPLQILLILLIVLLIFGTKRLRSLGSDLGSALRGFRKGLSEDDDSERAQLRNAGSQEAGGPPAQTSRTRDDDPLPR